MAVDHTYQFNVAMSCGGCSGAVTRVLNRLEGVKSVDANLETQLVTVTTAPEVDLDTVYNTIKKSGKEIRDSKVVV